MSMHQEDWIELAKKPVPMALAALAIIAAVCVGIYIRGWFQ